MVRVGREEPLADGAGHRVQVIAVVPGRGGDHVIAAGDRDQVLVPRADGDVEVSRFCIDALEREALLRIETVVIELLEGTLDARLVLVVLVGWIRGPVTRWREDFDQKQPRRRILLRKDPMDAPFGDALPPDFHPHIVGSDQSRGERRFGRRRDDRQVQRRPRAHAIALAWWEQQRRGFAAEDVLALANVAKAVDVRRAPEPDDGRLFVASLTGQLFGRLAPDRSEREIGPAGGLGADTYGGVVHEAPTLPSPASGGG